MKDAVRLTLKGRHRGWIVRISTDADTVLPVGTLITLSHTVGDVISTLDQIQQSLPSGLRINLEKQDTTGSDTDTTL